jgi:hypothetical protein
MAGKETNEVEDLAIGRKVRLHSRSGRSVDTRFGLDDIVSSWRLTLGGKHETASFGVSRPSEKEREVSRFDV